MKIITYLIKLSCQNTITAQIIITYYVEQMKKSGDFCMTVSWQMLPQLLSATPHKLWLSANYSGGNLTLLHTFEIIQKFHSRPLSTHTFIELFRKNYSTENLSIQFPNCIDYSNCLTVYSTLLIDENEVSNNCTCGLHTNTYM